MLDFSINAVQALARALILDIAPVRRQSRGNALASIMIQFGAVIGYVSGMIDWTYVLPEEIEVDQIEVLCFLAGTCLIIGVLWTCLLVRENPVEFNESETRRKRWYDPLIIAFQGIQRLPSEIMKICLVQVFAWMAWFPFLFYTTAWIMEILLRTHSPKEPGFPDAAVRTGSLALFLHSLVALISSMALPPVAAILRVSLGSLGKCIFGIRKIWTWSLFWLGGVLICTWRVEDVFQAIWLVAALGISFAVATWAPFAMIGEELSKSHMAYRHHLFGDRNIQRSEIQRVQDDDEITIDSDMERQPLHSVAITRDIGPAPLRSGVVLGIHNIFIVLPQFISILLSSVIFAYVGEPPKEDLGGLETHTNTYESVGFVLRVGGCFAIIAAILSIRCWN